MRAVLDTTFRSLRVRNYRLFAVGQLIKLIGVWTMFTAQDWLVLDLSHNSPGALGVVTALQFVPVMLLTLYSGRLADRYDKRKLLVIANAVFAVTAIAFAIVVASGIVQLWHVFLFALLFGIANSVETPVRQAFVSELVELPLLPNALALSAATFNTARIGGPALAGVLLSVLSIRVVFLIATVLAIAPIFTYTRMNVVELFGLARKDRGNAKVLDGLKYVGKRADLVLPITLMAVVGMIGFNFPVTLAALAKINFHAGASSFGLLTTALAVGALGGALAGSGRRSRPGAYRVIGAALAFGVLEFAVGFAPNFIAAMVLLVPTGFFSIYLAQAANHRVQMGVDAEYRGRVMALYVLVFLGTTPIGASLAGWWGEQFGVPSSIWVAGLVSFVAAVATLIWQLRVSGDRLRVRLLPRPALHLISAAPAADPAPAAASASAPGSALASGAVSAPVHAEPSVPGSALASGAVSAPVHAEPSVGPAPALSDVASEVAVRVRLEPSARAPEPATRH
ncbi:MFS transporter [Actinoplanes sp. NPDC020271]|uniref:MFS transporter n=1 Tax=Actinoplanes sp. NPDC020271 TaxID=3363896 RepID=UPI00378BC910